jgi:hypothetical protein
MFFRIDRPFFGEIVLNSDYVVEMCATRKKYNDKEYAVTVVRMADGKEYDAFDTLSALMRRAKGKAPE